MTKIYTPLLAAVDLPGGLGEALRLIMMFGFLFGTVAIVSGAMSIKRGDSENGKLAIVAGVIIGAAPTIMYSVFKIFGLDTAALLFK